MEEKERLIKLFVECYDDLDSVEEQVRVHNIYARENCTDNKIFENDDDFIDEMFSKPSEAVRAISFGSYDYNDNYAWFNGYGNLESASYYADMPLIDAEEMADWFIDNYKELNHLDAFDEFCERCEYGFDEED